ncbi:MAG: EAL domain-containing protein, partial [Pseudomonadota bacterium]
MAIHAFVREITAAVENVAAASIWSDERELMWLQVFQAACPESDRFTPAADVASTQKQNLGKGYAVYHLPLDCSNAAGIMFSVVVYSVDPPNLQAVQFAIDDILQCLARQIDVDLTLTTQRLHLGEVPTNPLSLSHILDRLLSESEPELAIERLVEVCREEYRLEGVVVALPGRKLSKIAVSDNFGNEAAVRILPQLHKSMKQGRRVVTATVSLHDGTDGYLVAAPLLFNKRDVQGLLFVISAEKKPQLSGIVRSMANRIGTLFSASDMPDTLISRYQLVGRIDDILKVQPSLPHSLVYFDMDKMHTINDAFGFTGGDRALTTFKRILLDSAGPNDAVSHVGSDRFAMFLRGASGETALAKASHVLRRLAEETIDDTIKAISLSASAGVVDTGAAQKGPDDMLILAEVASRGAKDRGGNQTALFQDIDSSIIQRRSDVDKVGFLQMALIENRFTLHAQRIHPIGATSGQKFELLARLNWDDVADGSPANFLSAAERYQLMAAFDRWVINAALTEIANASNPLEVGLSMFSINISAQSIQDTTFIEFIESRIAETGVAPDTLCFELTETSLVRHLNRAQKFVHRIQRLGCHVALDDFGTGYSNLVYLQSFPVTSLKIDRSFIDTIGGPRSVAGLVLSFC